MAEFILYILEQISDVISAVLEKNKNNYNKYGVKTGLLWVLIITINEQI